MCVHLPHVEVREQLVEVDYLTPYKPSGLNSVVRLATNTSTLLTGWLVAL